MSQQFFLLEYTNRCLLNKWYFSMGRLPVPGKQRQCPSFSHIAKSSGRRRQLLLMDEDESIPKGFITHTMPNLMSSQSAFNLHYSSFTSLLYFWTQHLTISECLSKVPCTFLLPSLFTCRAFYSQEIDTSSILVLLPFQLVLLPLLPKGSPHQQILFSNYITQTIFWLESIFCNANSTQQITQTWVF